VTKSQRRQSVDVSCIRVIAAEEPPVATPGGLDEGGPMKNAMEILAACLMVGLICLPTLRDWLGKLSD